MSNCALGADGPAGSPGGRGAETTLDDYRTAIIDGNVLLKRSASTRTKTFAYLRVRSALDAGMPLFRALRTLYDAESASLPQLAMLAAVQVS